MSALDIQLARLVLAALWLTTGLLSLGIYPLQDSLSLLERVGLHGIPALATLYLAATLDFALGLLTLLKPDKAVWAIQAMLVGVYTLIISFCLPEFWLHPFGPVLKNLPILLLLWLLYKNEGAHS